MKLILTFITIFFSVSSFAFAHPGRTNSQGCHNNRKTGEYHCHNSSKQQTYRNLGLITNNQDIAPIESYVCGAKVYCNQMSTCREAMYHMTTCGLTRLDGDSDGKPCENLCGDSR